MRKAFILILGLFVVIGCGGKQETAKVAGYEKYQEPFLKVAFSHPQGWLLQQDGTKISFYSSPEAVVKFNPYSPEGAAAARIIVNIDKMDTVRTLDDYVRTISNDLTSSGFDVTAAVAKNITDIPGKMIHYTGALDAKNRISGDQVVAIRDSMVYMVEFEGFNKMYDGYKVALDTLLASLNLPGPKIVSQDADPSIPAAEMETFDNNFLKIAYPANFSASSATVKAPVEFALNLMGYRKDSYVAVDVRPAQGLALEKVVEQNAKFFKETSRGEANIDGVKSIYLNYSPMKDIQSRVYFLVKNDKLYRMIVNYYAPMRSDYLPVFEKMAASLVTK